MGFLCQGGRTLDSLIFTKSDGYFAFL